MPKGIFVRTAQHKRNISAALIGKLKSSEAKQNMRLAKIGYKPTEEQIKKGVNTRMKNNWNKLGYGGLHLWVNRELGKASHCSKNDSHISTRYHWANISGEYKRELSDWKQLCPHCNRMDGISKHPRFL